MGIFCLELGKKHTFWHWEWGRISAPKSGDREPWEPTEVEDCFTEDIMPDWSDNKNCNKFADNYVIFDPKFTPDMWAGIRPKEKRENK